MIRSKIWEVPAEEFCKLIEESLNYSEVLRKLRLRAAGSNARTLKKRIKADNLSVSHFNPNLRPKGPNAYNAYHRKPLDEILVENSRYSRSSLKKRLIDENLLDTKCAICGLSNTWQDKPLVLVLDHINGVYNDNRLKNLRLLCPNCNSQTETFCGKNVKPRNMCVDCGTEIVSKSTRCRACQGKHVTETKSIRESRRKVPWPSHHQLKKDLETLNYCAIGRKYGVSDNAVRKWERFYKEHPDIQE